MSDEYKEMLERFEQICQNAKKELCIEEKEKSKDKEIERLNNIINELEKWLDEESENTILSTGHLTCLMMCKNKLQELKGSSNNE